MNIWSRQNFSNLKQALQATSKPNNLCRHVEDGCRAAKPVLKLQPGGPGQAMPHDLHRSLPKMQPGRPGQAKAYDLHRSLLHLQPGGPGLLHNLHRRLLELQPGGPGQAMPHDLHPRRGGQPADHVQGEHEHDRRLQQPNQHHRRLVQPRRRRLRS